MDLWWISEGLIKRCDVADLDSRLATDGGFVWIDVPLCDDGGSRILSEALRFHPLAVQACRERSHVPKVHAYPDYLFLILHAPEQGDRGHVHLLELDQFIGRRYLVTVHGPLGEGVEIATALRETDSVLQRMQDGKFFPTSPAELSYAITSAIARRQEAFVSRLASEIAMLERRIMTSDLGDPEELLEEVFKVRHELLTVRTMAAQSKEVYGRLTSLGKWLPPDSHEMIIDLLDQFERVRSICDGEKEFLQGVLDFYQSRTTTKINIAMERLALIAAIMLPVSAIAAIYGMNIIVPDRTNPLHIAGVVAFMVLVSVVMLRWARRQGWW